MTSRGEGAIDDVPGSVVAPHRVNGNANHSGAWVVPARGAASIFFDRPRLPPAIVAAVGAHAVRWLRLVAVRAFAEAGRLQRVVRPALRRPRLGVWSFGIRHSSKPSYRGGRKGQEGQTRPSSGPSCVRSSASSWSSVVESSSTTPRAGL
jgi:hypothetical protein